MENVKTEDLMTEQIRWVFGLLDKHANFNIVSCNAYDHIKSIIYDENITTLSTQLDDLFKKAKNVTVSAIKHDSLIPVKDAKSVQDLCGIGFSHDHYIDNSMSYFNYVQNLLCIIALLKNKGFPVSVELSKEITPLIQNVADLVSDNRSYNLFFWVLDETYLS
jgi:hypothetical protein